MSDQLCFVIERNRLFMDKGLVYYNEAPIFLFALIRMANIT